MSMTIALDVGPLKPNPAGVGNYVRSLAQALADQGRADLILVGRRRDAEGLPDVRSMWRSPRMPYPIWIELSADRTAARSGATAAHYTDGLVPLLRSRPTIVTVLDMSLVREWRAHRVVRYPRIPLVLAAPRLASHVIAISKATADEVMRLTGTASKKIDVVPLASRPSIGPASAQSVRETERKFGLDVGAYIVAPGTIEPRKNHVRVIAAFEQLVRQNAIAAQMKLILVGAAGWKSKATIDRIAESDVRDQIMVTGYISDLELSGLFTGAAAVVYVSTYEGFGLPVVEAMKCRALVVTSNVSSMPEVCGAAGFQVDPFDVAAIRVGLEDALAAGDPERTEASLQAARFSWSNTAAATSAVYDAVF
jgi:glycosyltransferase involved in cell wall biosynthesis